MDDATAAAGRRGRRWIVPLALGVAVVVAVGVGLGLLLRSNGDDEGNATFPTVPVASSEEGLRAFAAALGHPIYWAGRLPSAKYELRLTNQGRVFVRYLPESAQVGDPRAAFLTVATYPVNNAVRALRRAAARGGVGIETANGGFAYYDRRRPTSVYFAAPSARNYQVEVFDPSADRARTLVVTGRIRPIR